MTLYHVIMFVGTAVPISVFLASLIDDPCIKTTPKRERNLNILRWAMVAVFAVFCVPACNSFRDGLKSVDNRVQQRHDDAYDEGRDAGRNGIPVNACPYGDSRSGATMQKTAWIHGWQAAYLEKNAK